MLNIRFIQYINKYINKHNQIQSHHEYHDSDFRKNLRKPKKLQNSTIFSIKLVQAIMNTPSGIPFTFRPANRPSRLQVFT